MVTGLLLKLRTFYHHLFHSPFRVCKCACVYSLPLFWYVFTHKSQNPLHIISWFHFGACFYFQYSTQRLILFRLFFFYPSSCASFSPYSLMQSVCVWVYNFFSVVSSAVWAKKFCFVVGIWFGMRCLCLCVDIATNVYVYAITIFLSSRSRSPSPLLFEFSFIL